MTERITAAEEGSRLQKMLLDFLFRGASTSRGAFPLYMEDILR